LVALTLLGVMLAIGGCPPPAPEPVVAGDTAGGGDADRGTLSAAPAALDFNPPESEKSFELRFDGGFGLDFSLQSDAGWLQAGMVGGTIVGGRRSVPVQVDRAGLADGLYQADLTVRAGSRALVVPVGLAVIADSGGASDGLLVSPSRFNFGATADTQGLLLYYAGAGATQFTIESDRDWLSVDTPAGENSGQLQRVLVQVERGGLPPGEHEGTLTVRADGGFELLIPVFLRVDAPEPIVDPNQGGSEPNDGDGDPEPVVWLHAPATLDFGAIATEMTLSLRRSADDVADYRIATDAAWLQVTPDSGSVGSAADLIRVSAERGDLTPGAYAAVLNVLSGSSIAATIPVALTVPDRYTISGRVQDADGRGIAGVRVRASDGGGAATTGPDGRFAVQVPYGWTGVLTPESSTYLFEPPNHAFYELLADLAAADFVGNPALETPPAVGLSWGPGNSRIYDGPFLSNERVQMSMAYEGSGVWRLQITNRLDVPLDYVMFPWQRNRAPIGETNADDFAYNSRLLGEVVKADQQAEYGWGGLLYPGVPCSPVVVVADGQRGRLVAAANWPPIECTPQTSLDRQSVRFDEDIPPGGSRSHRVFLSEVVGDESRGLAPWLLALDAYKAWLQARMTEDGRLPLVMTDAMRLTHGWLNVQLENAPGFDPAYLLDHWRRWKEDFPWMQCWGQMSNYAGDGAEPIPPLEPNEPTGCCLGIPTAHPKYLPGLPQLAAAIKAEGGLIGLYQRPRGEQVYLPLSDPTVVDGQTNYEFFASWVDRNENEYGANAFYLDVLGARYLGPPDVLLNVYDNVLRPNSVMEHLIEFAPTGFLASGGLNGGDLDGGPGQTKDLLGPTRRSTTFPPFVRYLLSDRPIFLGQSNNDDDFWGQAHDYWTERQVFLLGCKFDVINVTEPQITGNPPNPIVMDVVAERNRVGWWDRWPEFQDTRGLTAIPAGVDVRRFVDKDGRTLFAIDNWLQQTGKTFRFQGRDIEVPSAKISIVEFEP
jgi:hypothetical protein